MRLISSVAIAVAALVAHPANSARYLITTGATVISDGGAPTVFGNPAPTFVIQNTFTVDYSQATFVAAGTVYDPMNNYSLNEDAYLFRTSAISGFSFNIGNGTFDSADLLERSLGDVGPFNILLSGGIGAPTNAVFYLVDDNLGSISNGFIACSTTSCFLANDGIAISLADGGFGAMTVTVEARALAAVPEPASWAMLIVGFGLIGGTMRSARRRPVGTLSYR